MRVLRPFLTFLTRAVSAMAAFLILAHAVQAGETRRFDAAVLHYFQAHQSPGVHDLMTAISLLAGGWATGGVSLACLAACCISVRRTDALRLLVAVAGGQVVLYGLKALFHRARPEAAFSSLGYSFPSGHAFTAVTLYGILAYWLARAAPRRRVWGWGGAFVLILLIGLSRLYLRVHFLSDVAAGYAAGLFWLWACWQTGRKKRANGV